MSPPRRDASLPLDNNSSIDNSIFPLNWQRRQKDFLGYTLTLSYTGSIFEPGMGFLRRRDDAAASASVGYGWRFTDPASRHGSVELRAGHQWSASPNLTLSGSYQLGHVTFENREEEFTSHVTRLRAEVMFSTRLSVISFVQYNSSQNAVIANFRLRYNPHEGNDFYVVWNEGLVTEPGEFERPTSDSRTILVKYSRILQLGL